MGIKDFCESYLFTFRRSQNTVKNMYTLTFFRHTLNSISANPLLCEVDQIIHFPKN